MVNGYGYVINGSLLLLIIIIILKELFDIRNSKTAILYY